MIHSPLNFKSKQLFKWVLYVVAVALIVFFMPSEAKFNYQFEVGKPWKYAQLMATFDFPIYKSAAAIAHEQDSIRTTFRPYFNRDATIETEMLARFEKEFGQQIPASEHNHYKQYIAQTLRQIYEQGVVSNADNDTLSLYGTSTVLVVQQNVATPCPVSELRTVKEAYAYLMDVDTLAFNKPLLQQCNLHHYLTPNVALDYERTVEKINAVLDQMAWVEGLVISGQKIIDRGEVVTPTTYNILESLRKASQQRGSTREQARLILVGNILFVGLLLFCFFLYLTLFRERYFLKKRNTVLLIGLVALFPIITSLMMQHNILNVHMLPFAMVPIVVRVFMDSRTAFTAHIITVLLSSVTLGMPYEFVLLQIVIGMVAIFSLRELSERSQLFRAALLIMLTYIGLYLSYELIQGHSLAQLNKSIYSCFVINGVLLLLTYPLLFLLEKTFSFTSNVTLVELSNVNNKLLREMSEIAPGTFQHSMQVANLAAAAANSVNAKSQLVRTGALYHDIGKLENPAFFTENQNGVNPHNSLSNEQSAQIVIGHVAHGLKLAERYHLPEVIIQFIATHHGAGKAKYIYYTYCNEHPNEEVNPALFSYPGPNPTTKEQAILMMADAVEAASRSLSEYTEESIGQLVNNIIDTQMADGFFLDCPITYQEIATIKGVFKEKLRIAYHTRIKYPELHKAK